MLIKLHIAADPEHFFNWLKDQTQDLDSQSYYPRHQHPQMHSMVAESSEEYRVSPAQGTWYLIAYKTPKGIDVKISFGDEFQEVADYKDKFPMFLGLLLKGMMEQFPEVKDQITDQKSLEKRQDFFLNDAWEESPEVEELPEIANPDSNDERSKLLPKKKSTFTRWQKAYSIIKDLDRKYLEDYKLGKTKNPKPKLVEYSDAIANEISWRPDPKIVSCIKRAGGKGYLRN